MERARKILGRICVLALGTIMIFLSGNYLRYMWMLFTSNEINSIARSIIMPYFTLGITIVFFFVGIGIFLLGIFGDL